MAKFITARILTGTAWVDGRVIQRTAFVFKR
jgi:hypothetical protein